MNQNLAKLGAQLLHIWKQLGVSQRISVGLATLALLGSLIGLGFWSSRQDYGMLYGRLPDAELARVVSTLDEAKVPYRLGHGSVYVPSDKIYATRAQLIAKGIPRGDGGVGFEILEKGFGRVLGNLPRVL